jgi:16S rRNA (cytosine(967)-C(5))-methyltransferase
MLTLQDLKAMQVALQAVLEEGAFLRDALHDVLRGKQFSSAERAWIRETLYRVVQLKNRYWTILEAFSKEHPGKEDAALDIRLIIAYQQREKRQLFTVDREVQALLRPKSRVRTFLEFLDANPPGHLFPTLNKEPLEHLWRYHSHPLWLVRKWLGSLSPEDTLKLCRFNNGPPEAVLRVNPLKNTREELVAKLTESGARCTPDPVAPLAIRVDHRFDPLTQPGYREGRFTLQSVASQLVCLYVNPKPGMRVLDYCAGEGGKTLLLAHLMKGRGEVHAHDAQAWRLRNLQLRARREGVGNVRLEGLREIRSRAGRFDLVLLDVPCTGSGNLRHQPELRWKLQAADLNRFNRIQLELLEEAAPLAAVGRLLAYVTCSLFKEENHKVVSRFLRTHPDWALVKPADHLAEQHAKNFWLPADALKPFAGPDYFEILPHRDHMPAMFCAILKREREGKAGDEVRG